MGSQPSSELFPGFDRVYLLGEPGASRAFRAELELSTEEAIAITRHELRRDDAVVANLGDGGKVAAGCDLDGLRSSAAHQRSDRGSSREARGSRMEHVQGPAFGEARREDHGVQRFVRPRALWTDRQQQERGDRAAISGRHFPRLERALLRTADVGRFARLHARRKGGMDLRCRSSEASLRESEGEERRLQEAGGDRALEGGDERVLEPVIGSRKDPDRREPDRGNPTEGSIGLTNDPRSGSPQRPSAGSY